MKIPRHQQRVMHHYMRYRYSGIASFFALIFMIVSILFFALYINSCYLNIVNGFIALLGGVLFVITLSRVRNKLLMILIFAVLLFIIYFYVRCPGTNKL
ncbi:MAG: hypothetical protein QXG00_00565 [Candidatus Woesearchaeota archaeon]